MSKAKIFAVITALIIASEFIVGSVRHLKAQQQNPGVQQSGSVTSGHSVTWGPGLGQVQDGGAAPSTVTSVFSRTGAVVAAIGDYTFAQISGAVACGQLPALTGDITSSACATTLATVNANVGSFGGANSIPSFTVDGKGRIIAAAANVPAIPFTEITGSATLAQMAQLGGNSTYLNAGAGAGQPVSFGMPSCSTAGFALQWLSNTGFQCTSISGLASLNGLTGARALSYVTQKFTAAGTYTPTTGMIYTIIECVGNGGGGGGSAGTATQNFGAGGGGSGGYSRIIASAATVGVSQSVTFGATGSGGAAGSNSGTAGGDVVVGSLCTGKGGGGGTFGSAGGLGVGGAGGVSGTGTVVSAGTPGGNGYTSTSLTTLIASGNGGSSIYGGGAQGVTGACAAGNAGNNYGSGGSGAACGNTGNTGAGGAGSTGIAIFTDVVLN